MRLVDSSLHALQEKTLLRTSSNPAYWLGVDTVTSVKASWAGVGARGVAADGLVAKDAGEEATESGSVLR